MQNPSFRPTARRTLLILVGISLAASAISQTRTDTIDYRPPYSDLNPIKCIRKVPYQTFNGESKVHGTVTTSGKSNWDAGAKSDVQKFEESRTYSQGMLNGAFYQTYHHNGYGIVGGKYKIDRQWTIKGQFADGQPNGTWFFSIHSKYAGADDNSNTNLSENVKFENGKAVEITDQDNKTIRIDKNGLISGSGSIKGGSSVTLTNSVITNYYIDITGDKHAVTAKEKHIIQRIIEHPEERFIWADSGYAIDWQEVFLAQWSRYAEHIDRYGRIGTFATRFKTPPYSVRIGQLCEIQTTDWEKPLEYYTQRPKEYDELMTKGYYPTRYGRRYLGEKAAIATRERWIADQNKMLNNKLVALSENIHNGNCAAVSEIVITNGENSDCHSTMQQLQKAMGDLYPIVGCKTDSIEWTPFHGYIAQCTIYKGKADSIGYESYKTVLKIDSEGHIILDKTFSDAPKRIPNIWDTIDTRERICAKRYSDVIAKSAKLKQLRDNYETHYQNIMSDKTIKPEVRIADLDNLTQQQEQFAENIDMFETMQQIDRKMEEFQSYKKIYSLYNNYLDNSNINWNSPREKLETTIATLQKFLELISTHDAYEIERKANMARINSLTDLLNE